MLIRQEHVREYVNSSSLGHGPPPWSPSMASFSVNADMFVSKGIRGSFIGISNVYILGMKETVTNTPCARRDKEISRQ